MWNINWYKAENFQAFKDFYYNVSNNKLTMIYGQNLDRSKRKSNGSGKSIVLDIPTFAITGDCLRKLKSIKEIINNDETSCFAEIELENKPLKKKLRIIRTLSLKQSQKIEVFLNDKLQNQLKDLHPRESDKFIEEQLGISFDDLTNYYLISKFKYQSLFLANDSTKKEVINRFSKADAVDNVFPFIDVDIDAIDSDIETEKSEIASLEAKIQVHEQNLEELVLLDTKEEKNKRAQKHKDDILLKQEERKQNVSKSNSLIIDSQNKRKEIETLITTFNENLIISKQTEIDLLEEQVKEKRVEYIKIRDKYKSKFDLIEKKKLKSDELIKAYEDEIAEYNKFILETENHLAGEIECPNCHHKFILADKEFNVEEARETLPSIKDLKLESEANLKKENLEKNKYIVDKKAIEDLISEDEKVLKQEGVNLNSKIDILKKEKQELVDADDETGNDIAVLESDIKKNELDLKNISHQISLIDQDIKNLEIKVKEALKDQNKEAIDNLNAKIESIESDLSNKRLNLENLNEDGAKLEEWKNKFKRFKSFLANQSISQIQNQANYFLEKMKADMWVFIDGFRELSNKKIKEEITVELSRDGLTGESFGKFSGGEKSLADLASILSMQNIINLTSSSGGLGFLGIDEILESVDSSGMYDISKCLSGLNQTIMLIAHSQPDEVLDINKLLIQKKEDVSKIVDKFE